MFRSLAIALFILLLLIIGGHIALTLLTGAVVIGLGVWGVFSRIGVLFYTEYFTIIYFKLDRCFGRRCYCRYLDSRCGYFISYLATYFIAFINYIIFCLLY